MGALLTGFDLCRASLGVVGISAPEQSVLTVLAIMANDDAKCWPAINGDAGLTGKTKLSERTVQRAVQALKDAGHIDWIDNPGRGRVYIVHPRHSDTPTPVTDAPRQADTPVTVTPTPVTVAPKQPITTTSPKATPSPRKRAAKPPAFIPPSDIPEAEWDDFEEMRRRIGKPMTAKARDLAITRLRKLADAGYPPGDVLNHSTLNNYQGLFPPKDDHNEPFRRDRGQAQKPSDGFLSAIREAGEIRRAANHSGVQRAS